MKIPADVQAKLGKKRVRRTTKTDSLKKATRLASVWADDIWTEVEKARNPDWDYHQIKAGIRDFQSQGLSPDEIDDIALEVLGDDNQKYDAYERASNKVVVLKDHLEPYLKWCEDKGNSVKTIDAKRVMLNQFCSRFRLLEDVTEYEVMRWASERNVSGATQQSMRAFAKDFFKYLGQQVLFKKLDAGVLDGIKTKLSRTKHKDVISGQLFREVLAESSYRDGVLLLGYTGRRSIAVANLTCSDIIVVDGIPCFKFRIDKRMRPETHKPQVVPIHPQLIPVVDRLNENSADGYLLPINSQTIEGRSNSLQERIRASGKVTGHQFRTSIITMLHNSKAGLPEKAIRSVVGHSVGDDAHMKTYMAGLRPEALLPTVEAINWDNWDWT